MHRYKIKVNGGEPGRGWSTSMCVTYADSIHEANKKAVEMFGQGAYAVYDGEDMIEQTR